MKHETKEKQARQAYQIKARQSHFRSSSPRLTETLRVREYEVMPGNELLKSLFLLVNSLSKNQLEALYDYVDEALWDKQFETVPDALLQMGEQALAAFKAGLTEPLDLDQL